MNNVLRLGALFGMALFLAACNTTGSNKAGLTSSVSTHIDMKNRSMTAYASGKAGRSSFKLAHSRVKVSCLKPELVTLLRKIERHYGKDVIITSGYRSKSYNRRVGGARNSQHMHCRAADIRVPGVSKKALASYARKLSGVGGVGTYCRSSFVHVDVGPKRNWHWGCGKKKRRRIARRR